VHFAVGVDFGIEDRGSGIRRRNLTTFGSRIPDPGSRQLAPESVATASCVYLSFDGREHTVKDVDGPIEIRRFDRQRRQHPHDFLIRAIHQ